MFDSTLGSHELLNSESSFYKRPLLGRRNTARAGGLRRGTPPLGHCKRVYPRRLVTPPSPTSQVRSPRLSRGLCSSRLGRFVADRPLRVPDALLRTMSSSPLAPGITGGPHWFGSCFSSLPRRSARPRPKASTTLLASAELVTPAKSEEQTS